MSKLSFIYGPMNCGKSSRLLMTAHTYESSGKKPLIIKPTTDTRDGVFTHGSWGVIKSRFIKEGPRALYLAPGKWRDLTDILPSISSFDAFLVDEVQFLQEDDIWFLSDIVDGVCPTKQNIENFQKFGRPVICYGLKTTAEGKLFDGSATLIAIADELEESRGVCKCGKRATMHVRLCGGKCLIGEAGVESDNVKYESVCRRCFKKILAEQNLDEAASF